MRKQYYFRPSPRGHFAWDVESPDVADRRATTSYRAAIDAVAFEHDPPPDYVDVFPDQLTY